MSFFSISPDLVVLDKELPYDVYVNSSSLAAKERFVRLHPKGETLNFSDILHSKNKFYQLYVREDERNSYLNSVMNLPGTNDIAKTQVIKSVAISHLHALFDKNRIFTTELLHHSVEECKVIIESMAISLKINIIVHLQH